jgi:ABC-type xylose transport system permease subunit
VATAHLWKLKPPSNMPKTDIGLMCAAHSPPKPPSPFSQPPCWLRIRRTLFMGATLTTTSGLWCTTGSIPAFISHCMSSLILAAYQTE